MSKFKVNEKFIGATTVVKGLGRITIQANHADILARNGRHDLLEGSKPSKKLEPVKPLSEMTMAELRKKASGLDGYDKKLKKEELIELINAAN